MANDHASRPQHAQHMARIDPPEGDLRIMRVNAAQHQPVTQSTQRPAHRGAEEARAGPKVPGRRRGRHGGVRGGEQVFDGVDLLDEGAGGEGARGLVAHRVVAELVAGADEGLQRGFVAGDVGADDEEGGGGVVGAEDGHDFGGVGGGAVVDGEGDGLGGGGYVPEDIGPAVLEVAD